MARQQALGCAREGSPLCPVPPHSHHSNLIPRPGPCISSAPSSPSRSAFLADAATYQTTSFSADQGASPPPPAKPAAPPPLPPSDEEDFREAAADPCMGFPDADNMVPGGLGLAGGG